MGSETPYDPPPAYEDEQIGGGTSIGTRNLSKPFGEGTLPTVENHAIDVYESTSKPTNTNSNQPENCFFFMCPKQKNKKYPKKG